ncbi:MAG TPA: sulfite exporter TauE/SafE family protein, partial [Dehalococcoidales bacterium]|nr:sulfite exporter TauE/SafE family protein [Dehalococcoidales bacterium]
MFGSPNRGDVNIIWFLLAVIGLFIGAFGTLIGVAGGFLLVPVLLFMYPHESPASITSTSLTVSFFNALSGSVAYSRMKRIDYRSGLLFAATAIPGAIIGAFIVDYLNRSIFQYVFGSVLILVAAYLLILPARKASSSFLSRWPAHRSLTDGKGVTHNYSY